MHCLASGADWQSSPYLGLWQHHSSNAHLHMDLLCSAYHPVSPDLSLLLRTLVVAFILMLTKYEFI